MKAVLGLEDGTFFQGTGFGEEGTKAGELVFTTQMGGYMEALTDASYAGQILMFTYPLIGNYGVDQRNFQSTEVKAMGCVTREICKIPENGPDIGRYFEDNGLQGIFGIDTRMLTIKTRVSGTMRSALIVGDDNGEYAVELARKVPDISERALIPEVSCCESYRIPGKGKRIAVLDLGIKKNIAISLQKRGADLYIFPHDATHDQIAECDPGMLFITNGPGDPKKATATIECVKSFIGELPVTGICMGNQIAALALGGDTYKLKFGHRGSNQPVRDNNNRVYITTQNHGFAVDPESLPEGCRETFRNINDGTSEGFEDPHLNITCVQFHPEAHGGPLDTEETFFDDIYRRI